MGLMFSCMTVTKHDNKCKHKCATVGTYRHADCGHASYKNTCTHELFIADSRREMLQKWKKEKELMKKMDLAQQAKKKPFRVVHVDTEVFPFQKFTQPSKVFIANTLRISSFINITDKFVNLISKG